MTLDRVRLIRGAGLLAWAGFFDWLWLTGRAGQYVGPRTAWVVPFGGIVLTIAALLYLRGARARGPAQPASAGELVGLVALLAPLLLVAAAPASSLGALAVERKRAGGEQLAAAGRLEATADLTLYDVAAANASRDYARQRGIADGVRVDVDGLVSREERDGTIELSRFLASCCAADALPYSIDVRLPDEPVGELELSQWLRVRGTLLSAGDRFVLDAEALEPTDRPANPYGV